MELIAIYDRINHERGGGKEYEQVKIMTPDGERYDILSVNWDEDAGEWVIIGE